MSRSAITLSRCGTLVAQVERDVVVVAPLVDAHLLADDVHLRRRPLLMSSPGRSLSIEIAASWPCATAQMMFFGPNAASPPKNTFGLVDCHGLRIDHRHVPFVEFDAESRSIQGKAFSWPTATSTSSHSGPLVGLAGRHQAAAAFRVVLGLDLLETSRR
jgi:hypothetical protein